MFWFISNVRTRTDGRNKDITQMKQKSKGIEDTPRRHGMEIQVGSM